MHLIADLASRPKEWILGAAHETATRPPRHTEEGAWGDARQKQSNWRVLRCWSGNGDAKNVGGKNLEGCLGPAYLDSASKMLKCWVRVEKPDVPMGHIA